MTEIRDLHIERRRAGTYELRWQTDNTVSVQVFVGDTPIVAAGGSPQMQTSETRVSLADLDPDRRHYFLLRTERGCELGGSERRFNLDGAPNVRDLGGYETAGGGQVRWGALYRAGRLSSLSAQDQTYLSNLNIGTICDFRAVNEHIGERTDLGAAAAYRSINIPIRPGDQRGVAAEREAGHGVGHDDMIFAMRSVYEQLALNQSAAYRRMFEHLLDNGEGGFLMHCSAGKDRTGFGCALLLSALGVSRRTVLDDYLLTNSYYPPEGEVDYMLNKYGHFLKNDADIRGIAPMLEAREEYLRVAFDAIDRNFPDMNAYLVEMFGLNDEARRELAQRYVNVERVASA